MTSYATPDVDAAHAPAPGRPATRPAPRLPQRVPPAGRPVRVPSGPGMVGRVMALQRLAGNAAMTSMLGGAPRTTLPTATLPTATSPTATSPTATSPTATPPTATSPTAGLADTTAPVADSTLESEADRAADSATHPNASPPASVTPAPPDDSLPGRPLGAQTRRDAEHNFGHDFGRVRVRQNDSVGTLLAGAGAKALTSGQQIDVSPHVGDIESAGNRHLLHHELAHVVQQSGGRRSSGAPVGSLSAAPAVAQPAPTVTAVNTPAELGSGKNVNVTAVAAGAGALTWSVVGAPAGVTVVPRGRRGATVRSTASPLGSPVPGAGSNFQVKAALSATPADSATSANVLFVGVNAVTVAPNPAMIAVPRAGGTTAAPPNVLDPNRDGLTGNTGVVTAVTLPAARPLTVTLPVAAGATAAGTTITPGATTGPIKVRAQDTATGTFNELPMRIDAMPTKVTRIGPAGAPPAGVYGSINPIRFGQTDNAAPSNRVIGETITAGGSDAFALTPTVNAGTGGPNPAPRPPLSAPANAWSDQLFTGQAGVDANRFTGKNPPGGQLPAVWQLRQGFHAFGWNGVRAPVEFDNGFHIRSLIRQGNSLFFRTEHRFPGGGVVAPLQPYAAVNPLITFTNIALAANAPAAVGGVAADGVATGNATAVSSVAGRTVIWSVVSGPIAIPATPTPVATPAVTQAGLVPGNFRVKVVDQAFPNREGLGNLRIVPVAFTGLVATPATVPAGTNTANLTVNAAPGGRTVTWTVDAAAAAAGVTVVGVAAAPAVATTAVLTRPAGFTGTVTVTAADSVLPAKRASARVRFA